MAFHETRFPETISYGSRGGPGFSTSIVTTDSGAEQRTGKWNNPRRRFNAAYGVKTYEDLSAVQEFYIARQGALHGFRFKDFLDFTTASDHRSAHAYNNVTIGTGNGTTTQFQIFKNYISGPTTRTRNITKPVSGTVKSGVNGVEKTSGVDFTVDTTTGVITYTTAPPNGHAVTAGCEFDVPVRFSEENDSLLQASMDEFDDGSIPDIMLVEIRDDVPVNEQHHYGGSAEIALAANRTLALSDGKLIVVNPSSAGLKLILPATSSSIPTGSLFFIQNASGANTVIIARNDLTTLLTLGTSSGVEILLSVNDAGTVWTWTGL